MSDKSTNSFWTTIPGMLTGLAATITAIGGLLLALSQAGLLGEQGTGGAEEGAGGAHPSVDATSPSPRVTPEPPSSPPPSQNATQSAPPSDAIDLLLPENGGELIGASSGVWTQSIDGKEEYFTVLANEEAIYGFGDGQQATFHSFRVFIPGADGYNLKQFELLVGNDSPAGAFESIGEFSTQNIRIMSDPYQEFIFDPVTARYLKFIPLSRQSGASYNIRIYEFQLFGTLDN